MNANDDLKTFFTARFRQGWLDLIERTSQAKPADFEELARANGAAAFDLLTPEELVNLRLDVAIDAEVQRSGGKAAHIVLPDGTSMHWNEVQRIVNQFTPGEATCTVLHLKGHQCGGFIGCAARLVAALKENGRRLIVGLAGGVYSASTRLVSEADFVVATVDSTIADHSGRYDSTLPVKRELEDLSLLPDRDTNTSDGAGATAQNAHCVRTDSEKFFPKFKALLGSQDLRTYFSQPVFSADIQAKLFAALARAGAPDDLEKRTFEFFWEGIHNDFLFTRLMAPAAHALGAIDLVI